MPSKTTVLGLSAVLFGTVCALIGAEIILQGSSLSFLRSLFGQEHQARAESDPRTPPLGNDADGWGETFESSESSSSQAAPRTLFLTREQVKEFKAEGDWCAEHKVPESMCTVCNPALVMAFKAKGDWCAGHGVPESLCALCNSEVADLGIGFTESQKKAEPLSRVALTLEKVAEFKSGGDWCSEHQVPESMCVKCNPKLVEVFQAKGDWCSGHGVPESLCADCNPEVAALGIGRDWCEKHHLPRSQCVMCNLEAGSEASQLQVLQNKIGGIASEIDLGALVDHAVKIEPLENLDQREGINPNCHLHATQIRFASPSIAREIGLQVEPVQVRRVTDTLTCYGQVAYNQSRFVWLSGRTSGIVDSVSATLGSKVARGEVLATVDSAELGGIKAEYLRAQTSFDRWKWVSETYEESLAKGSVSKKEWVEAQASLEEATVEVAIAAQRLRNLGLQESDLKRVLAEHDTTTRLLVRAPFDSTVVELKAVPGQVLERGEAILGLADTSAMWLLLDVYVQDLPRIEPGQPVTFFADGMEAQPFRGVLDWVSTDLDEKTRTAQARAMVKNPDGRIRAGLFGRGQVEIHRDEDLLTVSQPAVQWDGCCNVVFVRASDQVYQPRKVRVRYTSGDRYVVDAGLFPGEQVVTTGSYLLKTEILKGSIGAGCCEGD